MYCGSHQPGTEQGSEELLIDDRSLRRCRQETCHVSFRGALVVEQYLDQVIAMLFGRPHLTNIRSAPPMGLCVRDSALFLVFADDLLLLFGPHHLVADTVSALADMTFLSVLVCPLTREVSDHIVANAGKTRQAVGMTTEQAAHGLARQHLNTKNSEKFPRF